ncbi:MAG TPA: sugar ABC transporter substrate-binding protein [Acidimicrobiales bacterium]|nr:sugar ABC transporter substrate-binding protein [Acidimicrobiales bacterium]
MTTAVVSLGAAPTMAAPRAPAASTFGVNATGTVQFWNRSATCLDNLCTILVKNFNATHPGLKVVVSLTCPNCDTSKLATAIRAGDPPDVVGLNDIDVPAFSQEGALMNITQYVNALPFKNDLSPGHLALGVYNGQNYAVPYLGDLSVLWYNKTLFQKAGLNPNDPPTSFAQILSDSQKITALGNGIYGFSFAGACQGCLGFVMQPDLWAVNDNLILGPIGKQTINIVNNGPLKQLLQLYRTIWVDKLADPSSLTDSGPTWGADFEAGKVGILPGAYGFYPGIMKSVGSAAGIAPLPGPDGGYSTFDGGDDFVIPAGAKNPSGAWEFINWVLQPAQQELYPTHGYTPVLTNILTPAYAKANPYDAVALKALAKGSAPVTTIYDQAFNEPNSPWFQMFSEAVYKGNINGALQTGQSGFEAVAREANDLG